MIIDTAFSPDRTQIAVASSVGIWLYDAATGTETALAPATPFGVSAIAFSPDGKTIACGSDEGTIWLRRLDTGRIRPFPPIHTQHVLSVAFSPDGKIIASGSRDRAISIWDTETGKLRKHLTGHTDAVNIVAFSPDGKTLASGSSDRTVRLWNAETGELWYTFLEYMNNQNEIFVTELAFSPDGKMIASGATEWPTLYVWDIKTGEVQQEHHSHNWSVDALAFSPDGTKLAVGGDSNAVEWLDVKRGATGTAMFPTDHPGWVSALAFSPDGKTLTTVTQSGTKSGTIRFWDTTDGDQHFPAIGHKSVGTVLAFSPDSRTLATGNADDTIHLWDIEKEKAETIRHESMRTPTALAFSPDGTTLANGKRQRDNPFVGYADGKSVVDSPRRHENPNDISIFIGWHHTRQCRAASENLVVGCPKRRIIGNP